jgi:hypothetical protein
MIDKKHLVPAVLGEILLALGIIPFTSLVWLIVFRWGDPLWWLSRRQLDLRLVHGLGGLGLALGTALLLIGWRGLRRSDRAVSIAARGGRSPGATPEGVP